MSRHTGLRAVDARHQRRTTPDADITERLMAHGVRVFGPTKAATGLDVSKALCKQFMAQHSSPTARFEVFTVRSQLRGRYFDSHGRILAEHAASRKTALDSSHANPSTTPPCSSKTFAIDLLPINATILSRIDLSGNSIGMRGMLSVKSCKPAKTSRGILC